MNIFQKLTPQAIITPVLEFTRRLPSRFPTQVKANKTARSDMLLRHASFSLLTINN